MGILYNRFTQETSTSNAWTLIKTFTEVNTAVTIGITGYTEILVVCNDIVSMLFCITDRGSVTSKYQKSHEERIYNTNTGTGYHFDAEFYQYGSSIKVSGRSYDSVSSSGSTLNSINTKVYAR